MNRTLTHRARDFARFTAMFYGGLWVMLYAMRERQQVTR